MCRVKRGAPIHVNADGYDALQLTFGGESALPVALDLNTVTVAVVDDSDHTLVAQATIASDGKPVQPDGGHFILRGVKQQAQISAQADGYLPKQRL